MNRLSLNATKPIVQLNEKTNLTGYLLENGAPAYNKTVYFYEVYTGSLSLTASNNIIATGDTVDLTATLKDATDGSLVAGETVYFFVEEDETVEETNNNEETEES